MIILLVLLQLGAANETNANAPSIPLQVVRPLSEASLPANMFGKRWKKPDSIIVDDWSKLDELSPVHRKVVGELNLKPQLEPHGIVGVADYTLVRTEWPLNTVTVNAFLFTDSAKCDKWWEMKCQYKGWEKDFKKVVGEPYQALDAVDTTYPKSNKRLIKFDNSWVSAHQLGDDDKHVKAAEHVISQLTRREKKRVVLEK